MHADLAVAAPAAPMRAARSPGTVVARLSARRAARSGALWGLIFGIAIASSEVSYTRIYTTQAQRDALAAAYGSNKATSALFGPAPQLNTVGGFTVFKISMTLMILGAVWGLLTSTRLLRGEEDEGRWELLLTGRTTRRGATTQALAGLGAGAVTLWYVTAIITVLSGRGSKVGIAAGPSLYLALSVVTAAVMFLGVGALTSQLAATRRQAAAYAAVVLGVSYALRMIADAGVGLHWLIWTSPLGWVEELRPITDPQPLALLPIVAFAAVLALGAVRLAGTRDAGASIVADRSRSLPHLALLSGPTGLAIRLLRATVVGWWVAIAVAALLYGLIAKSAGATISGSSVKEVFSKLGAPGTGADAVLGVCFLVLALLIGFVAAGQVTAARGEESGGRLDHILVRPVSRTSWLSGRLLVAVIVLLASGIGAGFFAWLGAASHHSGVGLATLLAAGVNLVPPAITILGIGVLAFGTRPRTTSFVVYGYLGWSLLIVIIGGIGATNHWVLDTSVFHHMASAPAVPPDWETNGIMIGIGVACSLAGGLALRHRDLQGE
jgi:ABC-2 type transport system permease protein